MAAIFCDEIRWPQEPQAAGTETVRALLGEDSALLAELAQRREELQQEYGPDNAEAMFPLGERYMAFLHVQRLTDGSWESRLRVADVSPFARQETELPFEQILPGHNTFALWTGEDHRFLHSFRQAALLTVAAPESRLYCLVDPKLPRLAEAVLAEIYCHALPPQVARMTAVASTAAEGGCRTDVWILPPDSLPPQAQHAVTADFSKEQPELRFALEQLTFAQRTIQTLLGRLDLEFVKSMWNAAVKTVIEKMGVEYARAAPDLVAWQMLRKNFASRSFAITPAEHDALARKVKHFQKG
ncbi:MAG: hypothetical protein LBJ11_03360 [Oscillospiraceae bacterium]|jgi:hypothetical protein|nr:hypothetical protein [Oscillospiraceae bacterium]